METVHDEIALFRFKLIAPLLNEPDRSQKDYLLKISSREHHPPGSNVPLRYKASTIKKWLHRYRKYGFAGLVKNRRKDAGTFRKIPPAVGKKIISLVNDYDFRTRRTLYEYCAETQLLDPQQCTYATLVHFAKEYDLFSRKMKLKKRKSFEKPAINMLWTGDFMYGPKVRHNGKTYRCYLFTLLDDHSRFPVGSAFSLSQDSLAVESVLKKALLTHGIPAKLYLDNAKVFVEKRLEMAGARIGFIIAHSEPGDAASRGKIERHFRTVRDRFLDRFMLDYANDTIPDFTALTAAYERWMYETYIHARHAAMKDSPYNRYMCGMKKTAIRHQAAEFIYEAFYVRYNRKVDQTALVSIGSVNYEVPGKYIGQRINLYRDNERSDDVLYLYDTEQLEYFEVRPVNRAQNAEFPIRYHDENSTTKEEN